MNTKKTKKLIFLKLQLGSAILALIMVLISGFFIFGPSLEQVALALNPTDYNKAFGSTLNVTDWNRLDEDFVAKSGDTITGPLTLPSDPTLDMQAATKRYVDVNAGGGGSLILDQFGTQMKMVCGREDMTLTNTVIHNSTSVHVIDIDTSSSGFLSTPIYIVSIYGLGSHYKTTGGNSVYDAQTGSFDIYIKYWDGLVTDPAPAPSVGTVYENIIGAWGWGINWCAIGN